MKVTSEQYGEICDVVERTYQELPLTDNTGFLHTSSEARTAANRIIEILGLDIQDPRDTHTETSGRPEDQETRS